MKGFVEDPDFLLGTGTAVELYHGWAERMPIVDYHCHIDPKDIWEDRHFEDLSQVWLRGDHYKWRLMRSNGVPEEFITGERTGREKFQKFAEMRGDRDYYVRGTFTRHNLDFSKDVMEFADLGFRSMSIEPVVAKPEEEYAIREEDLPQIMEEYDHLAEEYIKRKKEGRGFNFLPTHYVALVPQSGLVRSTRQAMVNYEHRFAEGLKTSAITIISGPSNSGDIEMELVVGVHGPVQCTYVVISDR